MQRPQPLSILTNLLLIAPLALSTGPTDAEDAVRTARSGDSVAVALGLEPGRHQVAVDGGLSRPLDDDLTFVAPGLRLVRIANADGSGGRWLTVDVEGEGGEVQSPATVWLDTTAPSAELRFDGPTVEEAATIWIAPQTTVDATADDPAGVRNVTLELSGSPRELHSDWPPGHHQLAVRTVDGAGNEALVIERELRVDGEVPTVGWEIVDPGWIGSDGEPIYLPPVRLRVSADDVGVGLAEIRVGGEALGETSGADVERSVFEPGIEVVATDRLGNMRSIYPSWRYDDAPPDLALARGGEAVPAGDMVRIPSGDALVLSARDEGVGVERAEYRVNGKDWLPLADSVRFVDRGWYQVELRAVDRAGHSAWAFWDVRTGNPRSMRPERPERPMRQEKPE